MSTRLITRYTGALYSAPEHCRPRYEEFRDMFSEGQLKSKIWLTEELSKITELSDKRIAIAGSWYGTQAFLILESPKISNLRLTCIDIDSRCKEFISHLPKGDEYAYVKAVTEDMFKYEYSEDIVINTSCEHIPNLKEWLNKIPVGTIVVLQSNNLDTHPDHINCVKSIAEFKEQVGFHLSEVLFEGEMNFGVYTRFMLIAKKGVKSGLLKVKEDLNAVSPTFCIAKWKQVTLHLHNGRTHSCHHPYPHAVSKDEIKSNPSALHNTKEKKEARRQMLTGARPPECQYCWNVEDLPGFKNDEIYSDRITKSSEHWALHHLDEISKYTYDANVNPSYIEVSFSNLCNFKCSYCSPVYSSKWHEEIEKHGPYKTSAGFNSLDYYKSIGEMPLSNQLPNPYVEAFWNWWPDLVGTLEVFRITGGEPLLSPNTFRVLDYLAQNPQPKLKLGVNTNGNAPQKLMDEFISKAAGLVKDKKIAALTVFTSVDGFGQYAEYGRHGLNYSAWLANVYKILSEIPGSHVVIMCTTNILSIPEFKKFIEVVLQMKNKFARRRINLDINILRFPHHQNLAILPDEYKNSFDEALEFMKSWAAKTGPDIDAPGFSVHEINSFERLVQYVKEGPHPDENISIDHARSDFYRFITEHDRRRGTDFYKTFPQLQSFFELCQRQELRNRADIKN